MKITAELTKPLLDNSADESIRMTREFYRSVGEAIFKFAPDLLTEYTTSTEDGDVKQINGNFYVLTDQDRDFILSLIDDDEAKNIAKIAMSANREVAMESVALKDIEEASYDVELDGVPLDV